jgi:hypothetical protein
MQIALTQGSLVVHKSGRYLGFTPEAPASFGQIKSGDIIVFRVLETTPICPNLGHSLEVVHQLTVTFKDYAGKPIALPWAPDSDSANFAKSLSQRSLTFTSVAGGMDLPCHFERNSSDGIVTYKVTVEPEKAVPYLFSVLVETSVMKLGEGKTAFYQDDPEMVISPDGGPGGPPDRNQDPPPVNPR